MRRPLALIPLIALGLLLPVSARSQTPGQGLLPPRAGTGLAAGRTLPEGLASAAPETPCWVSFVARRADLDDPAALTALLDEARGRQLKTLVRLEEAEVESGSTAWTDRLLGFATALGDRVDAYQVLGEEAGGMPAKDYAFLLKNARVSIRAGGSNAVILGPPFDLVGEDWPEQLFAEDAAPYLDVIAASHVTALEKTMAVRDKRHPRAPVWVTDSALPEEGAITAAVAGYLESVSAGAEVVIFRAAAPPDAAPAPPATEPAAEPTAAPTSGPAAEPGSEPGWEPPPDAAEAAEPTAETSSPPAASEAAAPPAKPAAPSLGEVLSFLRSQFPPGLRPAAKGALPFNPAAAVAGNLPGAPNGEENGSGQGAPGAGAPAPDPKNPPKVDLVVLPFFYEKTRDGLAAYRAGEDVEAPPPAVRLPLRSPVESLELVAPEHRQSRTLSGAAGPGATVILPLRKEYRLLRYRLALEAIPVKESTDVGASSELTAEEIIAFERERRGVQEARVDHYEAKADISVHWRLASLAYTLDLSSENRLYVHDDGKEDYEQLRLYVNGADWRSQEPPALPFLQPEQVGEAPLDIVLDENYRYTLQGRDTVDGRDCYVLAFEPMDPTQSLYTGKVWIDRTLFIRVRMQTVQGALKPPLRSNETVYHYGPIQSDVGEVWLPVKIDGQMTYELLGYTLAMERERTFSDFLVNEPGIDERLAQAFDSKRPIFRDTGNGLQRVRVVDGEETLESLDRPRNAALVFGFTAGEAGDLSFPFAGVNFFDFNFHGTGTQFNLAIAGPFADISWNQPNILTGVVEKPWSLALQGSFTAIELEDEITTEAGTPREDRVDILGEAIRATLSIPTGEFLRWSIQGRAYYQNFDRQSANDDEGEDEATSPDFVLPPTNVEAIANLRLEFSRLGYQVAPWAEWGTRSDWGPWGRCADVPGGLCEAPGSRHSEDDRDFTRLGIDIRKSYFFGLFHKISLGLSGFQGRSLDRFSRFELGDFRAASVRGFNSSGIHFDRGVVGEASYAFGISKALRAEIGVEEGFVRSDDDFPGRYNRVIGSGLNLEFTGPWGTFVNVRIGAAVSSTIEDKGSGADLRVVFFKTWDKWSRKGGKGTSPTHPPTAPGPVPPDPVPVDPDR